MIPIISKLRSRVKNRAFIVTWFFKAHQSNVQEHCEFCDRNFVTSYTILNTQHSWYLEAWSSPGSPWSSALIDCKSSEFCPLPWWSWLWSRVVHHCVCTDTFHYTRPATTFIVHAQNSYTSELPLFRIYTNFPWRRLSFKRRVSEWSHFPAPLYFSSVRRRDEREGKRRRGKERRRRKREIKIDSQGERERATKGNRET